MTPTVRKICCALLLAGCGSVRAQTDEIEVYDAQIAAPGRWNLTWHDNFTPAGRTMADFPGGIVPDHALNGVPEWAYGVNDWFELGAYVPIYSLTADGRLLFDGFKLRTLFVVPHAAERSFFYGVNLEYSDNQPQWESHRLSGEIRPIIGWRVGALEMIINPILDTDYNGLRNLDFAPAERLGWNFSAHLAVALEHYADFGRLEHLAAAAQQSQSLFAVIDFGAGRNALQFGVGHGFTPASDRTVLKLILMHDF